MTSPGEERGFLEPWPIDPTCAVCGRPVATSTFDATTEQTAVTHRDEAAPACYVEGGNPFRAIAGELFEPVRFAPYMEPSWHSRSEALLWAEETAREEGRPVHIGFVRREDGHRVYGIVADERDAL